MFIIPVQKYATAHALWYKEVVLSREFVIVLTVNEKTLASCQGLMIDVALDLSHICSTPATNIWIKFLLFIIKKVYQLLRFSLIIL